MRLTAALSSWHLPSGGEENEVDCLEVLHRMLGSVLCTCPSPGWLQNAFRWTMFPVSSWQPLTTPPQERGCLWFLPL